MPATEQTILNALHQLPHDRWEQVQAYVESLREPATPIRTAADLARSDFVGIWADRDDIDNSRAFARELRQQAASRA